MRIKHAAQKLSARTAFFVTKAARVLVFMILDYCVCRAKEVLSYFRTTYSIFVRKYFRTKVLSYESTFRKYFRTLRKYSIFESTLVLSYGSTRTVQRTRTVCKCVSDHKKTLL